MVDSYELMKRMRERIAELPTGYLSKKNIRGKIQYYRQWRENGKVKSKYVCEADMEQMSAQIEERKRLENRLKELEKQFPQKGNLMEFKTNLITGEELQRIVRNTRPLQKRDCFIHLQRYLRDDKNWINRLRDGKILSLYC